MHENPWQCGCRACLEGLRDRSMTALAVNKLIDTPSDLVVAWHRITLADVNRKLEKLNERTNAEH